ncbi:hypothetical protein ACFSRY_06535 [Pontibacter locisalis]|uniref:Sensory transduction regulator n=1 Tax=Pontibacter locisalis TaxID=1719035 RepID=A0ABW5INF0_9BACT
MKEPILHPLKRSLARTAVNLLCGIELDEYGFYAYVFYSVDKSKLQCALYVGSESVLQGASFSPTLFKEPDKLDAIVKLARYTITSPTSNVKYMEWRDTKDALRVDGLLERYEDSYTDAVIRLFKAFYQLQR